MSPFIFRDRLVRLQEQIEDKDRDLKVERTRSANLRRYVASLELENAELRRQLGGNDG